MAASATFALKAGVWFRRGRLLMVSPDSRGTACPPSGRNSTYRPVQISGTGSFPARLLRPKTSHFTDKRISTDVKVPSVSTDESAYEGEDCCHHGRHVRNWRGRRGSTRKNGRPDRLGRTRQGPRGRDPRAASRRCAWHRPLRTFCRSLTLGRDETRGSSNRRSRVAHRHPD